ncbi:adenosine kinase-like isoform X2 [Ptychodera flava]|uniref:adenosine kinase-like isoform X2 n=1 Tax=Ptychodera flava TaxID=63121 RepID=UPI00396A8C44
MPLSEGILMGLGNPLLDISTTCDPAFLEKYGLKANDAILAEDKHVKMYDELVENFEVEYIAGGATQNSIRVAQWLLGVPHSTTIFGCAGKDKFGKILREKAEEAGVKVNYMLDDEKPTGTCAVLLTDHNRSLCAYLAAANCYKKDHLDIAENWAYAEKAKVFYVAGFHLTVAPDAILTLAKHALEKNKTFCMNLSAPFLCQFFKEPMMDCMPYVDILFGNETEAAIFSKEQNLGTEDCKEIAMKMAELPKENKERPRTVVITQGCDPVIVVKDGKLKEYSIIKLSAEEIVDTNGAGDAFVGGFLAQFVQDKDIDECVRCGIYASNYIIKQSGVTLKDKPNFQ